MTDLPEDLEQFISEHFDSLERLEIVLLLRMHRSQEFVPGEVTAELRLGPASAPEQLEALMDRGFVAKRGEPPRYRYAPDTSGKEALMNALANSYAERRVTVIKHIFSPRNNAARTFADAFKLRRK